MYGEDQETQTNSHESPSPSVVNKMNMTEGLREGIYSSSLGGASSGLRSLGCSGGS